MYSPGIDEDEDSDEALVSTCTDADVFVYVCDGTCTIENIVSAYMCCETCLVRTSKGQKIGAYYQKYNTWVGLCT